jgi:5,10-methenyltetrahydrofolate synthetase
MNEDKARLRREMVARRDAIPAAERSRLAAALADRVTSLPQYAAARSVLATMSIGSELSTKAFIERSRAGGKLVVLPRVTPPPRHLELHVVEDFERDLVPGVWDIPEPEPARCRRVELAQVDFALVPALAIDRGGYRLGYGAGYFDRLLARRGKRPYCVTALPSAFVVERVPREAHDAAVDLVINEFGPAGQQKEGNP